MRSSTALLALASLVAAQTSSSSIPASGCGTSIDLIIQNCLGTETTQMKMCTANDWDCLCEQQTNVVTCYNNCPSDPSAFGAQQQLTSWCNAAKAYGKSASSSVAVSASVTPTSSGSVLAVSAPVSSSASQSSSATPIVTHNAAAGVAPATGVLAVVFGLAALL